MKRYFIGYKKPNGFCDHLTTDAIDESDARAGSSGNFTKA